MLEIEILVVEDTPTQAEQIKNLLESHNYTVIVAKDGEEALAQVYKHPPTIIISDILMPVMDGFELCRIVKENPDFRNIPFILLTSLSDPDDIIRGLDCGADNFVVKPFEDKYLVTRIKSLLTNFELRSVEKINVALDVFFGGNYYTINSDRRQILDLLMSTFENTVQQNKILQKSQLEISTLNQQLEENNEELIKTNELLKQEIEERKKIQQNLSTRSSELKSANEKLKQFAYVVSHDLQEPLRMITSYTQMLSKKYKDKLDESANEFISFITNGTSRMKILINDILEYSKIGTVDLPKQKVDCNIILQQVLENLSVSIQESKATISYNELPSIMADSTMLIQIFQNLISNAIKFKRDGVPVINISSTQKEKEILFAVSDEGIGIEEKDIEKIFDLFQRLHTTNEYEGTGVGLSVCKKLIDSYNGNIWVESKKDKGSTFYFTLPV